jgi:hypothetical protein
MMKPPNVKPVYPLRKEKKDKEEIDLPSFNSFNRYTGRKGGLIVWNLESTDPKSPMFSFGEDHDIDYFLRSFREMDSLWKKDYDVYILVHPTHAKYVQRAVDQYEFTINQHVNVHPIEDPFNVKLSDFTDDISS